MRLNVAEIRRRLEQRRKHLTERRDRIRNDLQRTAGALSADFAEQAVEVQNDEALVAIERAAQAELNDIEAALERLALGKYGICRTCGSEIEPARLLAAPQSVYCVGCGYRAH